MNELICFRFSKKIVAPIKLYLLYSVCPFFWGVTSGKLIGHQIIFTVKICNKLSFVAFTYIFKYSNIKFTVYRLGVHYHIYVH